MAELAVKKTRRYKSKRATASQSAAAIRELISAVRGRTHKRKAIVKILGCSPRTATRILRNDDHPYTARIPHEWVRRICTYTQTPLEEIMGMNTRLIGQGLMTWIGEPYYVRAMENATKLGVYVTVRAFTGYKLSGGFAVEHHDGQIKKVVVTLVHPAAAYVMDATKPPTHILTLYENQERLWLQHDHPTKGRVASVSLSDTSLKRTLDHVFSFYKNIPAKVARLNH